MFKLVSIFLIGTIGGSQAHGLLIVCLSVTLICLSRLLKASGKRTTTTTPEKTRTTTRRRRRRRRGGGGGEQGGGRRRREGKEEGREGGRIQKEKGEGGDRQ